MKMQFISDWERSIVQFVMGCAGLILGSAMLLHPSAFGVERGWYHLLCSVGCIVGGALGIVGALWSKRRHRPRDAYTDVDGSNRF